MNLLISGGTGFLGKYIYRHWKSNGYNVDSVGRGNSNEIVCDISTDEIILQKDYEYFIHCAGKAHSAWIMPSNIARASNSRQSATACAGEAIRVQNSDPAPCPRLPFHPSPGPLLIRAPLFLELSPRGGI